MTMEFDTSPAATNYLHGINRIKCNGSRIQVGDRDFTSASEALEAYLDQYSGMTPGMRRKHQYRQNVSDLLDPKSVLHLTADRALDTGVRDTVTEMKLAEARDSINDSYDKMKRNMALRAEGSSLQRVDEALDKSGELLQRIASDDVIPDLQSDIGSLNTDVLLSINPAAGLSNERKKGHIYGYKKPKGSTKGSVSVSSYKPTSERQLPSISGRTAPPSSYKGTVLRERSRSVSPSSFRHEERMMNSPARRGMNRLMDSSQNKAPSWVEALDISNPGDNLWYKRDLVSGRPAPSWVNGLEKSDIASLTSDIPHKRVGFADNSLNRTSDSIPPGLSVNDLLTKSPGKSSLKSTPKSKRKYDYNLSSKLPKEVTEAGNISASSSDILDKYLETSGKGDDIYDVSRPPRCSSLDTEALIAGIAAPNKSDITGASPIVPSEKSPGRRRHRPTSPDTDMVLDGDRSWEKPLPTYKSPVNVELQDDIKQATTETDTLTGTPQPGSLEALKNMLFKLQTEAAAPPATEVKPLSKDDILRNDFGGNTGTSKIEEEIPALKGYNWQEEPGGHSLEKALVHLNRLKTLVNEDKERIMRSRSPSPAASLRQRSKSYSPTRSTPMYS